MRDEMRKWERKEGVEFLKKIGIRSGQTVLDFGCRAGHYTIPAAKVIGNKGTVYAVDKEQEALNELGQKANALDLSNIKIIKTSGEIQLNLENESMDVVLLYDVLHYFKKSERKRLYQEVHRLLKRNALLSVYPKHTLEDNPIQEFKELSLDEVKQEIENSIFSFEEKYCETVSHDDDLNKGCVLNFRKKERKK